MKKKLLRGAAFLVVLACILGVLNILYTPRKYISGSSTSAYQELPEGSVDVLYTGASGIGAAIVPTAIWAEYGITGYNISTALQMSLTTYYTLQEALEYQSPKLLVLDGGMLLRSNDVDYSRIEPSMRRTVTAMSWSQPKADAIKDIISRSEKEQTPYSYYLPILAVHSRWGAFREKAIDESFMGNFNYADTKAIKPIEPVDIVSQVSDTDVTALISDPEVDDSEDDDSEGYTIVDSSVVYFQKIFELCKERDIQIVIVKSPSRGWKYEKHRVISEFCAEYGVDFIDMNTAEYLTMLDLDFDTDFRDTVHLNILGGHKASLVLGGIFAEKYGLQDKRGTVGYEIYDEYAEEYLAYIEEFTVSGSDA